MTRLLILKILIITISSCSIQKEIINEKSTDSNKIENELLAKISRTENGKMIPKGTLISLDSQTVNLKNYEGKFIVLDFWATWCQPCIKEQPFFKLMEEKYKNQNIEFITISIDAEYSAWKKFIDNKKWTGNNLWLGINESEPIFSFVYHLAQSKENNDIVLSVPRYVLISPRGIIINNNLKEPSTPEFEKVLKDNLN